MQFGIQQQFAGPEATTLFPCHLGPDSCCMYKDNTFLVVLLHRKFSHMIFMPIFIIPENLKKF